MEEGGGVELGGEGWVSCARLGWVGVEMEGGRRRMEGWEGERERDVQSFRSR